MFNPWHIQREPGKTALGLLHIFYHACKEELNSGSYLALPTKLDTFHMINGDVSAAAVILSSPGKCCHLVATISCAGLSDLGFDQLADHQAVCWHSCFSLHWVYVEQPSVTCPGRKQIMSITQQQSLDQFFRWCIQHNLIYTGGEIHLCTRLCKLSH